MTQTQNKQEGSFSIQVGVVPGESRPGESRGILKFELPVFGLPRGISGFLPYCKLGENIKF